MARENSRKHSPGRTVERVGLTETDTWPGRVSNDTQVDETLSKGDRDVPDHSTGCQIVFVWQDKLEDTT